MGKRSIVDAYPGSAASQSSSAVKRWRHLAVPPGLGKPCSPELHAVNLRLHRQRLQAAISCHRNFYVPGAPAMIVEEADADQDRPPTLKDPSCPRRRLP